MGAKFFKFCRYSIIKSHSYDFIEALTINSHGYAVNRMYGMNKIYRLVMDFGLTQEKLSKVAHESDVDIRVAVDL